MPQTSVVSYCFTCRAGTGGNSADGHVLLYVVPVKVNTPKTLDLAALDVEELVAATYTAFFGRAADASGFDF